MISASTQAWLMFQSQGIQWFASSAMHVSALSWWRWFDQNNDGKRKMIPEVIRLTRGVSLITNAVFLCLFIPRQRCSSSSASVT